MWSFFSSSSNALHRHPEFPLQLLQDAIETRDERKVWRVLREQRIRNELIQSTTTHKVPRDPQQQKVNVITDDQGRTALGLACLHGHGRLASYVLDLLTADEEVGPLHALNFALRSGDERCVLELLRNRKVQWVIRNNRRVDKLTAHGEWNQSHRVESGDDDVSVSRCVAAAVEKEMVRAVQSMHRLNRHCVGHATWFALCSEVETCSRGKTDVVRRPGPVRPEFDEIAALYRRDCIWERIQIVFLMRYAPDRSAMKRGLVRLNIVAELPDAVFRIVAEFLKPKFNDAEEVQKERFKTVLNLSSW
ncbi:hypothetical protein PRIC2_011415 [Phytophthora ramorum]